MMTIWGLMIMNKPSCLDKFYVAAFGDVHGLGNKSIATLVNFFGSAYDAWNADNVDLLNAGLKKKTIDAFIDFRRKYSDAPQKIFIYCFKHKINLCSFFDDDYPPLLKSIDNPPMFFFYRGQLQSLAQRIAVVGTRNNTVYGETVATEFAERFAAAGLTVVSGAARGIDSFAHCGALKSGRTVAVLGWGIDFDVPRERKKLLDQIAENGVVLSEFNPQFLPSPWALASRNRIIAGLANGLVVIEAALKSGSLIAANFASNFGRKVFAVPGAVGCDVLIRDGAVPVVVADDVLRAFAL